MKITLKSFLNKAKITKSPAKFLAQHREYLVAGDFSKLSSSFIASLENGECLPTECLNSIYKAFESELTEFNAFSKRKPSGDFVASVYDHLGGVVFEQNSKGNFVELVKSFDNPFEASRWCNRRLFDAAPECYAEVVHSKMILRDGSCLTSRINRNSAFASLLSSSRGPVMSRKGSSSGSLVGKMKVKGNSNIHFSHG